MRSKRLPLTRMPLCHFIIATLGFQEAKLLLKSVPRLGKKSLASCTSRPLSSIRVSRLSDSPYCASRVHMLTFILSVSGMAVTTPSGGMTAPWSVREGDTVYVPDPTPVFYHDVEPALAEQAVKHLVRQSYETLATTKKHVGWNLCPSTYIFCTEDRGLPVKRIEESLPRLLEKYDVESQWEILFLHSAHSPFLNMPEAVAKLIRKAAGEQV